MIEEAANLVGLRRGCIADDDEQLFVGCWLFAVLLMAKVGVEEGMADLAVVIVPVVISANVAWRRRWKAGQELGQQQNREWNAPGYVPSPDSFRTIIPPVAPARLARLQPVLLAYSPPAALHEMFPMQMISQAEELL